MAPVSDFTWIVVAPGGAANARLAFEAARAGAWGFVDLEDLGDASEFRRELLLLSASADVPFGVKLDASKAGVWQPLLSERAPVPSRVLLSRPGGSASEFGGVVSDLKRRGFEVLVEAVSVGEALTAERAGADGIVAKGSEAAGRIGDETCFLLMQRLAGAVSTPFYAQGGVGLHTAAACQVAGARGAVLDWQLCLVEESRISDSDRLALSRLDGTETAPLGMRLKEAYRLYLGPRRSEYPELQRQEQRLAGAPGLTDDERVRGWRAVIDASLSNPAGEVRKLGMDVSFAARLAARFRTVGGVLRGIDRSRRFHLSRARQAPPLEPNRGVAALLGIRYPIVQGPMSRVSDTAAFASAVADAGGLPVMAIAAMREDELEIMLKETSERLGDTPWGAGLLGFLPPELYDAQVALVKKYRPPAAVVAGGRPLQAQELEKEGIRTFIHVPSHRLLELYLDDGVRNLIFEGLECGGHIGRYSAFVLWENAVEVLLAKIPRASQASRCAALFAGGISTALSAAMVSTIIAPLADRGVDVGVLVGTGYLFTREAVEAGAISAGFQSAVVEARETAILDCGGGYQIRAAPSPFCAAFEEEKRRLTDAGLPAEEVRMTLEHLTLGRLRIAAKGLRFNEKRREDATETLTVAVPEAEQRRDGVYMAGQAILVHDSVYTVEDLHRRIGEESASLLGTRSGRKPAAAPREAPPDVAIVGMSALFPGARDADAYWENILAKKYSITEVPEDHWSLGAYFDPEPSSRDKIYSRWGGFLEPIEFDPVQYGIPPKSLRSIDPCQILTLEMVDRALRDAGYDQREFDREHTSVFVGEGGGVGNLGQLYSFRSMLPMFVQKVPEDLLSQLPEWTEDSFPGLLPNVMAGRVASQFDLGGTNLSTSAACAAGLAALSLAMDELMAGKSRMSIVAAVDVQQNPFTYLCFSKTMALSPTGKPRCFDASSDGIVISQGIGVVILKRLEDAERDGDRIYAVLRGLGSSSDGKGKSLTAPMSRGQLRAMRRAYAQAGFDLDTVGLIEAHGTGTVLGDRTEAESMTHALREAEARPESCAVGTVKSMIGHTKGCAGIAGLIKVALALHHKVLPPTLWVEKPAAEELRGDGSPAYLNTDVRPWVGRNHPRRAGVSSFGFGGTNFHAVVEEHEEPGPHEIVRFPHAVLPAELICFRGPDVARLRNDLSEIRRLADDGAALAHVALRAFRMGQGRPRGGPFALSIVAESVDDLRRKLERAQSALDSGSELADPTGVYFAPAGLARDGGLALVFPGQGSQRLDMLKDLALLFGELRGAFERADRVLASRLPRPLSHYVYPPASFTEEERTARMEALTRTDVAQPALGAAGLGLYQVLRAFGVRPDMAAGHSVGEYVALGAAGAIEEEALYRLLWSRGDCMLRAAGEDAGTMMAIRGAREAVEEVLAGEKEIYVANLNAPLQTVVSGRRESLSALQSKLASRGVESRLLPVGCGFHSPFVEKAAKEFEGVLASTDFAPPSWPVYSNYSASAFPAGEKKVRGMLGAHLSHPVRFSEEMERMYGDGARVFLEVGPGKVCANLIAETLSGKPHAALSCDGAPSRSGVVRFLHALGQLFAQGVDVGLDPLFNRRTMSSLGLVAVPEMTAAPARPKVTWMVSPEVSWPAGSRKPQVKPLPALSAPVASTVEPVPLPRAVASGGNVREEPRRPTPERVAPVRAATRHDGGDGSLKEIVLRHQQLMTTFLEQQNQVMLAFLERRGSTGARISAGLRPAAGAVSPAVARVSEALPAAPPPPASVMVTEEVEKPPVPARAAVAPPPSLGDEELMSELVALVSERTGYPAEMLTEEQEMEADLGIDSIKRVEILTSFARRFENLGPEVAEELRTASTLRDVVTVVRERVGATGGSESPSSPVVEPAPAPALGADELMEQLVTLVSERTGYPAEMLTAEQEMEADLGIDSIKRVEILTSFARRFENLGPEVAEELRTASTLQDVVQVMRHNMAGPPGAAPAADSPASHRSAGTNGFLDRFVIGMKRSALAEGAPLAIPGGAIVVTDDGRGFAMELRERLESLGGRPVVVRPEGPESPDEGIYAADLADAAQVEALVSRIRRERGRIGGVIHLLPLRTVPPVEELSSEVLGRLMDQEVKGFFYLLRSAASDLKSEPGSWASTCLSFGSPPSDGTLPVPDHPWRGALIGVVKTVAVEWPEVVAKSLALEEAPSDQSISRILAELGGPRSEHEAYYRNGSRLVPEPRRVPLTSDPASVDLRSEDVILVVGGARGITAEVACELACQSRPTLVLVGRSPWPQPESDVTAGASDADLRRVLFNHLKENGSQPSPREVDAESRSILREREMRAMRSLMEEAGSRVFYYQADVRDAESTEQLLHRIYESHGRIDGVVSGAGVIEDKLIEDKTPESFDRVFDTKALAIFNLARAIDPVSLKFFVMFSSMAGWTGNRGQVDYVAANEVLNRCALHLSERWNRRVVAIDWGPWDKAGMVTPETRRLFLARGVGLVPPDAGRRFTIDEIRFGSSAEPIVAAMGKVGADEDAGQPSPSAGTAAE